MLPEDSSKPLHHLSTPAFATATSGAIRTSLSSTTDMTASFPSTSLEKSFFITPAIGRHQFNSGSSMAAPKKSILKRSSFKAINENNDEAQIGTSAPLSPLVQPTPVKMSAALSVSTDSKLPTPRILPRPTPYRTVGFSEQNTVAIFGDTSDDTADNESERADEVSKIPRIPGLVKRLSPLRQTSILSEEEEDDDQNISARGSSVEITEEETAVESPDQAEEAMTASSNASSLLTSKWWFGKDTRYITHCDRNGCNHKHHAHDSSGNNSSSGGPASNYLTPTQQKNKELTRLKKELKKSREEVEEKDRHLRQLRERVKEIDSIMETNSALREHSRLMQRQAIMQAEHQAEKTALIEKHEVRVRQLIQEAVDARSETLRKTDQFDNLMARRRAALVDATTNTDPPTVNLVPAATSTGTTPTREFMEPSAVRASPVPAPAPALSPDAANQLQAYQQEALIWRTKAAQLEIIVKDQIATTSANEVALKAEVDRLRAELERKPVLSQPQAFDLPLAVVAPLPTSPEVGADAECVKQLVVERNQLADELEERNRRIAELEQSVNSLKNTTTDLSSKIADLKSQHHKASKHAEERDAECRAAQLVLSRLQTEKEQLGQALDFLEERAQAYRNTILDNNLVMKDESSVDWIHGYSDPRRFSVFVSKNVQTELTSEALVTHEQEFVDLRERLREVQAEFTSKNKSLHDKFAEIEENLILKTTLVEALTKQLENAQEEIEKSVELRQNERETYQKRINALGKVAERVSFLENEYERFKLEKSLLERQFDDAKLEYEDGLEDALNGTMSKYREQATYFEGRLRQLEEVIATYRNDNARLSKENERLRLRSAIEKADLEQRLTSSIDHVTTLHDQLNVERRDAQCDAKPRIANKYVSCKPNTKEKDTQLERGDLFDEVEERLKLTAAELGITKRQVQVLQAKVFDPDGSRGSNSLAPTPPPAPDVVNDLRVRIDELESINTELGGRLREAEMEKHSAAAIERERIQQLAAEFDNVRRELDGEIRKYEAEKRMLKERVKALERYKSFQSGFLSPEGGSVARDVAPVLTQTQSTRDDESDTGNPIQRSSSLPALIVTEPESVQSSEAPQEPPESAFTARRATETGTVSGVSEAFSPPMSEASPSPTPFHGVTNDLGQVQDMLHSILASFEPPAQPENSQKMRQLEQEVATVRRQLHDNALELELFRTENAATIASHPARCKSVETLTSPSKAADISRWQDAAGTLFREVTRLRRGLAEAEKDRAERNTQLAILRGELEFARAQEQLAKEVQNNARKISGLSAPSGGRKESAMARSRFRSLSPATGSHSFRTANLSLPSLAPSEDQGVEAWLQSTSAAGFDTNSQSELAIVQEAFQKQVAALKSRIAGLEAVVESFQREKGPLSLSVQELSPVDNDKLHHLRRQLEIYEKKLATMEAERQQMYLVMFRKGQQAAQYDAAEVSALDQMTEDRIVLRFLHDAFYYFLINRNTKEHLQAIMTLLNFTTTQQDEIRRRRGVSH